MAEMNHVQTDYYLKTLRESWILQRAIFLSLSSIGSATRALRALIRLKMCVCVCVCGEGVCVGATVGTTHGIV